MLTREGHAAPADWWALGVILYELTSGLTPFMDGGSVRTCRQLYANILSKTYRRPAEPDGTSPELTALITALLTRSQVKRMRAFGMLHGPFLGPYIRRHPFFAPVRWDNLLKRAVEAPVLPQLTDAGKVVYSPIVEEKLRYTVPANLRAESWDRHF